MSRAFAKIKSTLYTGSTGRAMRRLKGTVSKDTFCLAGYLIAGPTANTYGLYQVDIETIALHLPVTVKEAEAAFVHLEGLEFSFYDLDSRWVWVREMAAQQLDTPLKPQDNLIKGIKRWYQTCPRNPWLAPFYDRYASDLCLDVENEKSGPSCPRRDEGASKGLPRPSMEGQSLILSSPLFSSGEGSAEGRGDRRAGPRPADWREVTFNLFWAAYPKQVDRKDAYTMWVKHVKTEEIAAHVLERLSILKPHWNYEQGMRFINKPCNWIERHKWDDEVPSIPDMNSRTTQTAKAVAVASHRGAPR